MMNATAVADMDRDPIPYVLTEQGEARAMLDELARLLRRGDRLNICDLARRMTDRGTPITRRQLHRWLNGETTPTVGQVEQLARAAGVDWAYLMCDTGR